MQNIITVDGPSGVGKGTIARNLSERLGWHFLDSGALYRVLAYLTTIQSLDNMDEIIQLAKQLPVEFKGEQIVYNNQDIGKVIRTETVGNAASRMAVNPEVRQALLDGQRAFAREPGLVADGRDMGTVVFPEARLKFFITASSLVRAQRRHKQYMSRGVEISINEVLREQEARDERDTKRSASPTVPADDAIIIDTSDMNVHEADAAVWDKVASVIG